MFSSDLFFELDLSGVSLTVFFPDALRALEDSGSGVTRIPSSAVNSSGSTR